LNEERPLYLNKPDPRVAHVSLHDWLFIP